MNGTTWIEVALNGGGPVGSQPRMPVDVAAIVDQGVSCAKAGAAIVHLHARDPASGQQVEDVETYVRAIEGIRSQVDVIVYPTIPLTGDPQARFSTVEQLAARGLLEWLPVDPGSLTFMPRRHVEKRMPGWVYENQGTHVWRGIDLAGRYRLTPTYSIYEPGFLRLGAEVSRQSEAAAAPVYRFMFSDELLFGFPPGEAALRAYVEMLSELDAGATWMVGGLLFDPVRLVPAAIELGGHVRVGLEDAPAGSARSNLEWVEWAASEAARRGTVGTARGVRLQLAARRSSRQKG